MSGSSSDFCLTKWIVLAEFEVFDFVNNVSHWGLGVLVLGAFHYNIKKIIIQVNAITTLSGNQNFFLIIINILIIIYEKKDLNIDDELNQF